MGRSRVVVERRDALKGHIVTVLAECGPLSLAGLVAHIAKRAAWERPLSTKATLTAVTALVRQGRVAASGKFLRMYQLDVERRSVHGVPNPSRRSTGAGRGGSSRRPLDSLGSVRHRSR